MSIKYVDLKMGRVEFLRATVEDAGELLKVYAPYVEKTAVSFEYEVPSLEEFSSRISNISSKYPYIKAVCNGEIVGYAYATAFKGRKAYDHSVESTIYLKEDKRGEGLGVALYEVLTEALKGMGIINMNACIAYAKENDPHLTNASHLFHKKLGFELVGTFHNSGFKFDRWYDMIWMEKMLAKHTDKPEPVKFGQWTI